MRKFTLALIVIATLLTLLLAGCGGQASSEATPETPAASPSPPPAATTPTSALTQDMKGLDVSVYSGTVDWAQVAAAGYGFAFAKATEGMDLTDPNFAENWPAMKSAGLIRGAYHFYVTEDDPDKMADFFIATVALEPGDFAPVVDIEALGHNSQPGLVERLQTFLDRLEKHYGVKPIIYTAPNFWDANLSDAFGAYPLWVAEYGADSPRLPLGWTEWDLWQWQSDAAVDGVEKTADLNQVSASGAGRSSLFVR